MALLVLACVGLLFAAVSILVSAFVGARFRRVWRSHRNAHGRLLILEETRHDNRREINACSLRVAELEYRAGMRPKPVWLDVRKVRPVDADELVRIPRLGDRVEADDASNAGIFSGFVSLVDHDRKEVSVTADDRTIKNFPWKVLRFAA